MGCEICELLNKAKLLIRGQYCIVNDSGILKCILNNHAENPRGCVSCIKSYMKEALFLFAQKFYDHSRFTIEEFNEDHLYYKVVMNETIIR